MTCKLSVNVNAVAYLRNRRDVPWPDLAHISRLALKAGAHGITVHPRPDERHVRRADVPVLAAVVREFKGAEFNIEGYPDPQFLTLCAEVRPDQVTLVPDLPGQGTSDHGWDIKQNLAMLREVIDKIKNHGSRVSLFIDPDEAAPELAKSVGADRVEIFTGPYGGVVKAGKKAMELRRVVAAGNAAKAAGLGLNAGHDLTRDNLPGLIKALPHLAEVSIGHGLFADALEYGVALTVRKFREAIGDV